MRFAMILFFRPFRPALPAVAAPLPLFLRALLPVLLLFAPVLLPMPPAAHAQERQGLSGIYTVRDLQVDERAKSAALARDKGLRDAQQRAFAMLLTRLALPGQDLSFDPAAVAGMVQAMEIASEKTSTTRYIARVNIRFKRDAVRNWLKARGIAFSESPARPLLVVALLERDGNAILWEENNPWAAGWGAVDQRTRLLPLLVPLGDLEDLTILPVDAAAAGDEKAILALARRYGADAALLARARLSGRRLDVVATPVGPAGLDMEIDSFAMAEGEDEDAFLRRAARRMAAEVEADWKRQTVLRFDEERVLSIEVPLEGIEDLQAARRLLEHVSRIAGIELRSLTTERAQLEIRFYGDVGQLQTDIAQRKAGLVEQDGYWRLIR